MTVRDTKRLGFRVDMDSCTGCKGCQLACKNKNALELRVLWRRVVQVEGGEWIRRDSAWIDNTFMYTLSLSCMHCDRPICAEVCPTGAVKKRSDGIVFIDSERCIGCSYCEMACPYGAPQFDEGKKVMTKCDLCMDAIDAGKLPGCVSACQMRVLEVVDFSAQERSIKDSENTFPLPPLALTEPSVVLTLRKKPEDLDDKTLEIRNREEI